MRRPLFFAALIFLCGTLLGLKETPLIIKLYSALVAGGVLWRVRRRDLRTLMTIALGVSFFMALAVAFACNTEASLGFYERFAPTNPGQFDYSLYLKSIVIRNEAAYLEYTKKTAHGLNAL